MSGDASAEGRFRVVVAEDDADLRYLVRETLDASGRFAVVGEAGNGRDAVSLAGQLQPDVLLLDLSMPVMSGVEAIGPIRDASPQTTVVVLSSFPQRRLGPVLAARGAVGYLEKGGPLAELPDRLLALAGVLEVAGEVLAESDLALPADLAGPRMARRFVEQTLRAWDCGESLDTVKLLVSEVVANAVVHAGSEARIAVQLRPEAIRVAVHDADASGPTPRQAAELDEGGRGLALVEAMASAWGVDPAPDGKEIWFEVPRFDAAAAT